MFPISTDVPFSSAQVHAASLMMLEVARQNGIVPAELALIQAFHTADGLAALDPNTTEAWQPALFESEAHRLLALSLCLATAFADGTYSPEERAKITSLATQLGVDAATLDRVTTDVRDNFIGALAHLPDTEAVAALARQLA